MKKFLGPLLLFFLFTALAWGDDQFDSGLWDSAVQKMPEKIRLAKKNLDHIGDQIAAQIAIAKQLPVNSVGYRTSQNTVLALYGKGLAQIDRIVSKAESLQHKTFWRVYLRYGKPNERLLRRLHARIQKTLHIFEEPNIYVKRPAVSKLEALSEQLGKTIGIPVADRDKACAAYLTSELEPGIQ